MGRSLPRCLSALQYCHRFIMFRRCARCVQVLSHVGAMLRALSALLHEAPALRPHSLALLCDLARRYLFRPPGSLQPPPAISSLSPRLPPAFASRLSTGFATPASSAASSEPPRPSGDAGTLLCPPAVAMAVRVLGPSEVVEALGLNDRRGVSSLLSLVAPIAAARAPCDSGTAPGAAPPSAGPPAAGAGRGDGSGWAAEAALAAATLERQLRIETECPAVVHALHWILTLAQHAETATVRGTRENGISPHASMITWS